MDVGLRVHQLTRANTLATKRQIAAAFVRTGSAQVVLPVVALLAGARVLVGGWGWFDLAALVVVVLATGPVEWLIHVHVLHASDTAWVTRRLGLGLGHREHHLDPPELRWLMLRANEMAQFLGLLAVFTVMWALPLAWAFGGGLLGPYLSALVLTTAVAGHYELTHLLVHTAYRPRTRYYARLARNHRLHHYRNERYWLGVTSNMGDRLFRTLPRGDESVPRSATARTLLG